MSPTFDADVALADGLGLPRPRFDAARRPDLAECWGDRVRLVARMRERGQDDSDMVLAVMSYGGNPVTGRKGPAPMRARDAYRAPASGEAKGWTPPASPDEEPEADFDAPRM